jgi:hypothetical protein
MNKITSILTLGTLAVLMAVVAVCAFGSSLVEALSMLTFAALGTAFLMRDASLKVTKALPAAASTSVTSNGIDTGKGLNGDQLADFEFLLTMPALNATMLPDTRTATYIIEHDTDPAFGTVATLNVGSVVKTGAGGVGAAADTFRFRLPTDAKRYIRAKCTFGASTADASTVSLTLEALL